MGKMSRDKGARYEREIAKVLKQYGYDCQRTAQHCGKTGQAADVEGLPGIHIECKHCERMTLYDWIDQAVRDSKNTGNLPAVFHRKNNCDTLVTMRLDDFMQVYNEYASGLYLKEKQAEICGNCVWYNGNIEDNTQFCDELESYVSKNNHCSKFKRKNDE